MEWLITNAVALLLMPLGVVLVILLYALFQAWRHPLEAWRPLLLAFAVLYVLSMQFVADQLLWWLEPAPRDPGADQNGQAIVVVGGGTYFAASDYGGETVGTQTLARLRYAAHLHRTLKKPVLVTGGAPEGNPVAEARHMKQVLLRDFQVPVQWVEEGSRDTLENARLSYPLLSTAGVRRIYLVTHAWHMARARLAFEHAGFAVIPAPTVYTTRFRLTALDFLPSVRALRDNSIFFHEVIGLGWYHLRILLGR